MNREQWKGLAIFRPDAEHECVICADWPPPSDAEAIRRGRTWLCESHEDRLRDVVEGRG